MKRVTIYSDGACSGNPGPGGWGCVLIYGENRIEISGFENNTTNNRMELLGPINALKKLKYPCIVDFYSDSAYLVNAFTNKWIDKWLVNGWKTSKKEPVENQDLWIELVKLTEVHQINWFKVKGHSDNVENNRCDELAREEISKHRVTEE